jgi:putative transposase
MGRPLSMDLRERAIARVQAGETTRSVSEALGIAPSSVTKWWQRFRETGSVSPGQMGGHKPRILIGTHRDWLLERTQRDFTLWGLVHELADRGVKVDYHTVWTFVHDEGLSFKKKRSAQRAGSSPGPAPASAVEDVSGTS